MVPITDAMRKVGELTGYTFTRGSTPETGLIAQEVQRVLPEAVVGLGDGLLGITYGNMAGLFVEAMKEMNSRIKHLEDRLTSLTATPSIQ
jgi:hypothetical protein